MTATSIPALIIDPEQVLSKPRLKSLLDHFGIVDDPREACRVAYPLDEVLLLVVCATICDCDDYASIADWGATHLEFLRRYLPYHYGTPGTRWLTQLMNRIDPAVFSTAFTGWVREAWPERPDHVAIDGKTSRRSHDRSAGKAALHLVSAFATTQRLVLGEEAVADKSNEVTAIPVLIDRLAENDGLKGAIISIDAIATNDTIATKITDAGAEYLLAVKGNQPTIKGEVRDFFDTAAEGECATYHDIDKDHGRIEQRIVTVSHKTDWLTGERRFPGEFRLSKAASIVKVVSRTEMKDFCTTDTRYFISSAKLTPKRAADVVRGHWGIENRLHWVLDVIFKEDQSRLRKGHGAVNMAIIRHFAINLVRAIKDNRSIKRRRKMAAWDTAYLETILGPLAR